MTQNNLRFNDFVVFITGGTSGIGLATAIQFAQQGAKHIIVCGRRLSKWNDAQPFLEENLSTDTIKRIEYWPCDVRVESQVKNTIAKIFEIYGRLDICFNNAGVQPGIISDSDSGFITGLFFDSAIEDDGSIIYRIPPPQPESSDEYRDAERKESQSTPASPFSESEIATSCVGLFYCLKWEIHYIFERQPKNLSASIINTSSRNGVLPDSHRPLYASSKAFILAMTRSVASQVAHRALKEKRAMIRINAISPGPVDTILEFAAYGANPSNPDEYDKYAKKAMKGVPMKRTARVDEIAPMVLFLGDPLTSSYITGANMCIDGGHTGSPNLE